MVKHRAAHHPRPPKRAPSRQRSAHVPKRAATAGERVVVNPGRAPGGPPDRDPFTYEFDADLGRRALEDATEAPAQERYEPSAEPDVSIEESEVEFSGEEEEWGADEEIGPIEAADEPDDRALERERAEEEGSARRRR